MSISGSGPSRSEGTGPEPVTGTDASSVISRAARPFHSARQPTDWVHRPPADGHTRRPSAMDPAQQDLHVDQLVRGHPGGTGDAGSGRTASSVSSTCWPYLASLLSPTPLTMPSSARVAGHRAATSRSVASWKIT